MLPCCGLCGWAPRSVRAGTGRPSWGSTGHRRQDWCCASVVVIRKHLACCDVHSRHLNASSVIVSSLACAGHNQFLVGEAFTESIRRCARALDSAGACVCAARACLSRAGVRDSGRPSVHACIGNASTSSGGCRRRSCAEEQSISEVYLFVSEHFTSSRVPSGVRTNPQTAALA